MGISMSARLLLLCCLQFLHLLDPLHELVVLALFVRMSLVLDASDRLQSGRKHVYLALPRHKPRLSPALIQRDQKVGASVSVRHWQAGVRHLLARGRCRRILAGWRKGGRVDTHDWMASIYLPWRSISPVRGNRKQKTGAAQTWRSSTLTEAGETSARKNN